MSSEIYTGFGVHTADPSHSAATASHTGLFDEQEAVVVVVTQSYSSNTHPPEPCWHIAFIGKEGEFSNHYIPAMAYYIRDGSARCKQAASGAAFTRLMIDRYRQAHPLDARSLHRYGYVAYSWSMEDFDHITDRCRAVRVEQLGRIRYGSRVQDDSDAKRLVNEALEVKAAHRQQGQNPLWSGRPWSLCSTLIHPSQR